MLSITPKTDSNNPKTEKLVNNLRHLKIHGQKVLVTGSTAMNIDISEKLNSVLPKFLLIIVALAFVLLVFALRSLIIPLIAVGGFVLSIIATLGAITFTIQEGHFATLLHLPGKTAVLNFLPVITIGILFGLAMDYEVFLVRQIHEEYLKKPSDITSAVKIGLEKVGSAVIAAALIMITVFASFAFTDEIIIQSMGLALAFGVFADAFIVRLLLVPSLIILCGKANWNLPKWLKLK
jgi:RND superfamily putative drug exporter/membrane protein YdfJ